MAEPPLIAVVGAGAAGLAAALELRDLGARCVLLEADARAGGKLGSSREEGFLIERAAIGVLDRVGDFAPLCDRLGLVPLPASMSAQARFAVRNGRLHRLPDSLAGLLGTRLFSLREKLSLLLEPLRRRRRTSTMASTMTGTGPMTGSDAESVSQLFARRLGPAGLYLAELLQTGIYAGDAERLDAAACFPELVRWERERGSLLLGAIASRRRAPRRPRARLTSFANGMGELPEAFTRALGSALQLGTRVRAIEEKAGGWRLHLERAEGRRGAPAHHGTPAQGDTPGDNGAPDQLDCQGLILALPAPQLAALLAPLGARGAALAASLRTLEASPLAQVHLGFRQTQFTSRLAPQLGFGILAPGRPLLGTLFPSALWSARAPQSCVLATALLGGAHHPELLAQSDPQLLSLARRELELFAGLAPGAEPLFAKVVRWREAVPQPLLGHPARVAALDAAAAALAPQGAALLLTGSWLHGVSVLDCLRDGRAAARAALRAVSC